MINLIFVIIVVAGLIIAAVKLSDERGKK